MIKTVQAYALALKATLHSGWHSCASHVGDMAAAVVAATGAMTLAGLRENALAKGRRKPTKSKMVVLAWKF